MKKKLQELWETFKSNGVTNSIALLALVVSSFALYHSVAQRKASLGEMRRQCFDVYASTMVSLLSTPRNTQFSALSPDQKNAAVMYWLKVVPAEILTIAQADPEMYEREYVPLIRNAASTPYLGMALCHVLKMDSSISGTRTTILRAIEDGAVHLKDCDDLVHKILYPGKDASLSKLNVR